MLSIYQIILEEGLSKADSQMIIWTVILIVIVVLLILFGSRLLLLIKGKSYEEDEDELPEGGEGEDKKE